MRCSIGGKVVKTIYDRIADRVKPYLDTRENEMHTAICYAAAKRLLACHPEADAEVVLPGVLLHDAGWKMVPEEKQLGAFGPHPRDMETRRAHETAGAVIAREILGSLRYDPVKTGEIITIIDGHDSRDEALSLNDALVKDADKLWRFQPVGFEVDCARFGLDRRTHVEWLGRRINKWFFTDSAREIAREYLDEVAESLAREAQEARQAKDPKGRPKA